MNFFLFNLTCDINVLDIKCPTNNNSKSTPQEQQCETKYGCTCTCCKQNNLPRYNCVIWTDTGKEIKNISVKNFMTSWNMDWKKET